jgi:hypothetical protein
MMSIKADKTIKENHSMGHRTHREKNEGGG